MKRGGKGCALTTSARQGPIYLQDKTSSMEKWTKATSYRCKHCEGKAEARKKGTEVAIEPGGREGGVLAKGELEEEEGGADEGDQDGVDEEEGEPALLHDHHGESPEGVERGGEGPACEQVVRSAGPQLLILYIMFCCRTHGVGVDFDCCRLYFS